MFSTLALGDIAKALVSRLSFREDHWKSPAVFVAGFPGLQDVWTTGHCIIARSPVRRYLAPPKFPGNIGNSFFKSAKDYRSSLGLPGSVLTFVQEFGPGDSHRRLDYI